MPLEPNHEKLHSLIQLVYEAATDPAQWPLFLNDLCESVRATGGGLVVIDSGNGFGHVDASVNVDPVYQADFVKNYAGSNPWTAPHVAHLWTQGGVVEGRQTISDEDMVKTDFYNGFLKPQGWFSALGGSVVHTPTVKSYLTTLRRREVPPDFGRPLLTALMPHLQTALRLHERISFLETAASALTDVLQFIPGCVMIVDFKARVRAMNASAEALLAAKNGLFVQHGYLVAQDSGETMALQTTISVTIQARQGEIKAPAPIAISRINGKKPLQIVLAPLPPQNAGTKRQPAAILFITDPEAGTQPNHEVLQVVFGLTEAEARIAAALTTGKSVEAIATERFLSTDTVRSHLRKIYAKTGTNRQGQLISLLLTAYGTAKNGPPQP